MENFCGSEATALYRAYDAGGKLLYVGIARNWGYRWAQHSERSAFYAAVTRLEVEWLESRGAALGLELALIREHQPPFNVRGRPGRRRRGRRQPILAGTCEVCQREPAYSFSWFPDDRTRAYRERRRAEPFTIQPLAEFLADGEPDESPEPSGAWRVTGYCTADDEEYFITFDRWVAEDDWLRHMRTKPWFDEADFRAAVTRVSSGDINDALVRQAPGRWS